MFTFDVITLFPEVFEPYLNTSILGRARKRRIIKVNLIDLRRFGAGRHRILDGRPYGGGAGMVLRPEPILKAVARLAKKKPSQKMRIIILSAKGKPFNQKKALAWSKKLNHLVLISGRYEGIDERVKKILKAEEISIGPYVLTDGDVPALVLISAVGRLLPGAIRFESLQEESHFSALLKKENKNLEYPHYTRPEILEYKGKKYRVPKVLLSGDHRKIEKWRRAKSF